MQKTRLLCKEFWYQLFCLWVFDILFCFPETSAKKVRGLHNVLCDLCECVLPEQYSCITRQSRLFRFVRSVQAPLQVKPALPVVQLNLVVECPVVSWMPSAVFCLDVTIFIFLSVKKGLAHHYRNRGHEPRADLVTGERQET